MSTARRLPRVSLETPHEIHDALRTAAAGVAYERWGATRARQATARSAAGRACPALSPLATAWDLLGALCVLSATPTPWALPQIVIDALAAAVDAEGARAVRLHLVTVRLDVLDDDELWAAAGRAAHRVWTPQAVAA